MTRTSIRQRPQRISAIARAAALAAVLPLGAQAFTIDTGNPDLRFNFDNTLKYSAAVRVKDQSATLTALPNVDDGDRNFKRGLISNRVDWLSEADINWQNRLGARVSAAAWYDQVYNSSNDNPGTAGGARPNQRSVAYNEFTADTRRLHGRKADLLDAFVFGNFDLGAVTGSVRLGRHTLLWGESLFLGANAIAGGMMPVDAIKLSSVPNTQFKEAIRPVPMVSTQLQLTPVLSLGAYYQFQWEANRLPAAGSYFSRSDSNPEGGENLLVGPNLAPRLANQNAKDRGQGGLQLRLRGEETDYGLYLIRFHSKVHQQVANLGATVVPAGTPGAVPFGPPGTFAIIAPASYRLAYHQGVMALGGSASRTFGDVNMAVEASLRRNQDLASTRAVDPSGLAPAGVVAATDNQGNPAYAIGKTAHVNVNALWTMPATALYNEASFTGELAWNRVLSITKNPQAVDLNATRDSYTMRVQMEPVYRQVVDGFDLGVPVGLGYSPRGSRSLALGPAFPGENSGDLTVGLNGTYLDVWRMSLSYTTYFGSAKPLVGSTNSFTYGQALKDRDFIAFAVRRTF